MNYIKISSKGLINERFFSLLGGSTKRNAENKIGFFGSGLKYSIAFLLREGVEFKIFIGEDEVVFTVKEITVNDSTFKVICINGKETDLTTDFGPKWLPWMIIREFYANAIDEGDEDFSMVSSIHPEPGRTSIFIKNTDVFKDLFQNYDKYFSFKRRVAVTQELDLKWREREGSKVISVDILPKSPLDDAGIRIYRKGFLIYSSSTKSLYDYNISHAEINEERLATYTGSLYSDILTCLLNSDLVKNIDFTKNSFELYQISNTYFHESELDLQHFADYIGDRVLVPTEALDFFGDTPNKYVVPMPILNILRETYKLRTVLAGDREKMYRDLDDADKLEVNYFTFEKSIDVMKRYVADYFNADLPKVILKKFKEDEILGTVDLKREEIYISYKITSDFELLLGTILEEFIHVFYRVGDKSREFQDRALECAVKMIAEKYETVKEKA